jgi:hypothetical protein
MDNYNLYIRLLGVRDHNLPTFKDARLKRYKSVQKMVELIETATQLAPKLPAEAFVLDALHPEWDDRMVYPKINFLKYIYAGAAISLNLLFYSYNYNIMTANIRFRTFRFMLPFFNLALFGAAYQQYRQQILKVNLFDEYVWLRAQEIVKDKEFILDHPDFKRHVWFWEDFKETFQRVHRQGNNHDPSDFADSELMLQDFINRYSDPAAKLPVAR